MYSKTSLDTTDVYKQGEKDLFKIDLFYRRKEMLVKCADRSLNNCH